MWLLAPAAPADSDPNTAIILAVIGLLTAVLVAVATGVFSLLSARQNRTGAAPPAPTPLHADHVLYERVAVLERRTDDADERFDVMDRARARDRDEIDDVTDYLDDRDPGWRS